MNRWLKLIFLAFLIPVIFSCSHRDDPHAVSICGTARLASGDYLTLVRIDTTGYVPVDSVKPGAAGDFCLKLKPGGPGFYLFRNGNTTMAPVVVHPGDSISVHISRDSIMISGGREAGYFDRYRQSLLWAEAAADSLGAVLSAARDLDDYDDVKRATDSAWLGLLNDIKERGLQYMNEHPGFLSLILVMNSKVQQTYVFDQSMDSSSLYRADTMLLKSHAGNPHVQAFHHRIARLKLAFSEERQARLTMKPGNAAPVISLPGLDGRTITFDPSKHKLTVVYFWSPTDGLCRKANQELKILFDRYREKGFGVFAVSLDQHTLRWKAAVNLDKLWWVNVNDAGALESDVAKDWSIRKLPVFVLIDRNGMIVDRYMSVGELAQGVARGLGR